MASSNASANATGILDNELSDTELSALVYTIISYHVPSPYVTVVSVVSEEALA